MSKIIAEDFSTLTYNDPIELDYYTSNSAANLAFEQPLMQGQSFYSNDGGTLGSIVFRLSKDGSPTGNAYAKIFAMEGDYGTTSVGTGEALATSAPLDVSTIAVSSVEDYTFSFSPNVTLQPDTYYVITLDYSGGTGTDFIYIWCDGDNMGAYHPGNLCTYNYTKAVCANLFEFPAGAKIVTDSLNTAVSQSFVLQYKTILKSAEFLFDRDGSPSTGNIVAKLYAHSGVYGTSSLPTGPVLATSDNVAVSSITFGAPTTFTFSTPYTMEAETNYVMVIEYPYSGGDDIIYPIVGLTDSSYSGNFAKYNGSTWTAVSDKDLYFRIFGSVWEPNSIYDLTFVINKTTGTTADWDISGKKLILPLEDNSTVDSYPPSNIDADSDLSSASNDIYLYQSFTGGDYFLKFIDVYLKKVSTPTGNITAYLYAETHATAFGTDSKPTGDPLATSLTISASSLSTSYGIESFQFNDNYKMSSGTKYCLVISYPGDGNTTHKVAIGSDTSSPSHSGNSGYGVSTGGGWNATPAKDLIFEVMGDKYNTSRNIGQSLKINDSSIADISSVTPTIVDNTPAGTSITYEATADNGLHWQEITSGNKTTFSYPGDDLKFRVTLNGLDTSSPYVDDISLLLTGRSYGSFSDTVTINDTIAGKRFFIRFFSDSVTINDSYSWMYGSIIKPIVSMVKSIISIKSIDSKKINVNLKINTPSLLPRKERVIIRSLDDKRPKNK